jgi:hypothetical protein
VGGGLIPEDAKEVPKHVGVLKDCAFVFVVCVFSWFSKTQSFNGHKVPTLKFLGFQLSKNYYSILFQTNTVTIV